MTDHSRNLYARALPTWGMHVVQPSTRLNRAIKRTEGTDDNNGGSTPVGDGELPDFDPTDDFNLGIPDPPRPPYPPPPPIVDPVSSSSSAGPPPGPSSQPSSSQPSSQGSSSAGSQPSSSQGPVSSSARDCCPIPLPDLFVTFSNCAWDPVTLVNGGGDWIEDGGGVGKCTIRIEVACVDNGNGTRTISLQTFRDNGPSSCTNCDNTGTADSNCTDPIYLSISNYLDASCDMCSGSSDIVITE